MVNKNQISIVVFLVTVLIAFSCGGNGKKPEKTDSKMEAAVVEVSISGMTCTGCEQTIQTRVSDLNGVKSVKASFITGKALVEYFPDITDTLKIKESITGSGYLVKKFNAVSTGGSEK